MKPAFPRGAQVFDGECDGLGCAERQVVSANIGKSWRTAASMDLCATCLDHFVAAGVGHVYALAEDGLFHEVHIGARELIADP
jgi:hypothetical protein